LNQSLDQKLLAQAVDAYEFRGANSLDVSQIVELYSDFFAESDWPNRNLVYDPPRMWAWVFKGITTGNVPHLLAFERAKGTLIGSICYTLDHNFTTRPFAHLDKFFVRRKWRRSPVGRVLLTLIVEIARADGAACFNANALSGMKEIASLKNLLLHMGFRETNGIAMTRNFDDV
jgi:GNAT superfamily N-acetyltransferase